MSIKNSEEVESDNLNNNTSLQILIEQNNNLIRLLKEINEKLKTNQLEIINEIRHFVQDPEKQVAFLKKNKKN